jgi:hypothetical protein
MMSYQMSLISAGSISLDSTFKESHTFVNLPLSVSKVSSMDLFSTSSHRLVYCLHVVDPEAEPLKSGGHVEERTPPPLPETDSLWYMSQSKVR